MTYDIIYADPPWAYNARNNTATRFGGGAMRHYETMSTEEICAMGEEVKSISSPDSLLFLWSTAPKLPDALRVMESWGFKFATVGFVWIKMTQMWTIFAGPGNYTASNAEFVLIGRRGSMLRIARRLVPSVVMSVRERHSQKPVEVARRIDEMYPYARKLEMFARRELLPAWTYHGNEVNGIEIGRND